MTSRFPGWRKQRGLRRKSTMHVEFTQADVAKEIRKLRAFDRMVFPKGDVFSTGAWKEFETYWMLVDGAAAGCCAFQPNVDFREDGCNPPMQGSLYISTTGILPAYQGLGFGRLFKAWQIAYAKYHGFHRIVTNNRKRNRRIIRLNESFGFEIIRTTPGYYRDPADATVVMVRRKL